MKSLNWGASWAKEGRGTRINLHSCKKRGGHQHYMEGFVIKSCSRFTLPSHPIFILNQPKIKNSRYLLASLLLAACVKSKESPSIPVPTPDNIEHIVLLCSVADQHQKQKDEIQDSPCVTHSWIKPGTSHLAISPFSHLSHLATSSLPDPSPTFPESTRHCPPTSPFLPPNYPPTFPTCPTILAHYPPFPSTFPAYCLPTFPTFAAHHPPTFPTFPTFPTLPLPFSSSLLTTLPPFSAQHLPSDQKITIKITLFH